MPDSYKCTMLGLAWKDQLPLNWKDQLADIWMSQTFRHLAQVLDIEYTHYAVLPEIALIFNAFQHTAFEDVRVVILGQDPYPNPRCPHGLAFSVLPGIPIPSSLINIFVELHNDLKDPVRQTGSLIDWAQQGVLLLNTCLTVRSGQSNSHRNLGWEEFTDKVIRVISEKKKNVVFLLWGHHAIQKGEKIDPSRHLILRSSHPSPLSFKKPCGAWPPFENSKPFSQTNAYLVAHGLPEIQWTGTF